MGQGGRNQSLIRGKAEPPEVWRLVLCLPPSLEEPYEAEAPRTVLKPSLSSNGV